MGGDPGAEQSHSGSISLGDDSATDLPSNDTATTADNPVFTFTTSGQGIFIKDVVAMFTESPSATCTGTATTNQKINRTESATCTGTASLVVKVLTSISATCTGTAIESHHPIFLLPATCTGTASLNLLIVKQISATCTGTATQNVKISLSQSATCTVNPLQTIRTDQAIESSCTATASLVILPRIDHEVGFATPIGKLMVHYFYKDGEQ